VAATYLLRNYADPTLKTAAAPGLSMALTWAPTDLTRLSFESDVTLAETATVGEAATTSWGNALTLSHALRDNLELSARASAGFSHSSTATDATYGTRLAATWAFNPLLAGTLAYEGTFYRPEVSTGNYDDHRILASLILRR
jgi:hypothetical protein